MAKIHFFYGVMSSSKSADLCINAYNLRTSGKKYEVIKPAVDNRDSNTEIVSRIGLHEPARAMASLDNYMPDIDTKFVLIDEVQFFSVSDIDKLIKIADTTPVTIFCYGLSIDSNGEMFPASQRLFSMNAEKHEKEFVCEMPDCCNSATHHLRFNTKGDIIRRGTQVQVGALEYKSVCRQHFNQIYNGAAEFNLYEYIRKIKTQKVK